MAADGPPVVEGAEVGPLRPLQLTQLPEARLLENPKHLRVSCGFHAVVFECGASNCTGDRSQYMTCLIPIRLGAFLCYLACTAPSAKMPDFVDESCHYDREQAAFRQRNDSTSFYGMVWCGGGFCWVVLDGDRSQGG